MRWALLALCAVFLSGSIATPAAVCRPEACLQGNAGLGAGWAHAKLSASAPGLASELTFEHMPSRHPGTHWQGPVACGQACPDLTIDPTYTMSGLRMETATFGPDDCNVAEGTVQSGTRRLLRFSLTTPNIGPADLHLGDPASHQDLFTWGDCHGHWHLFGYADYRLWTREAYRAWERARDQHPHWSSHEVLAAEPGLHDGMVGGHKQGFCLMDVRRYDPTAAMRHPYCSDQGISSGWADEYNFLLDGQWIDVTGVPDGHYVLELEVNPTWIIEESSFDNNRFSTPVAITGA